MWPWTGSSDGSKKGTIQGLKNGPIEKLKKELTNRTSKMPIKKIKKNSQTHKKNKKV